MTTEHLDVLIVGAGLSGIGMAYHLKMRCPEKAFAILEGRDAIGGTWDLFRYPGIRSDSDMFTLGYHFKPWRGEKSIADGDSIRAYIQEAASENGIDSKIRFQTRVISATWLSQDARWTLEVEHGPAKARSRLTCNFLLMCAGYYDYASGYTPDFPGLSAFEGHVIHPQKWPEAIDLAGKRVVVIGSGATAVTLIPELAKTAAHVTMLQRSPTYVVAWPEVDPIAEKFRARFSPKRAYRWTRAKNIARSMYFYRAARKNPDGAKARMLDMAREHLPAAVVEQHFTPRYKPWDQRVCLAPNGDIFASIREERTSVVTDEIDTFTAGGIRVKSGQVLNADVVVTATGLNLQFMGGLDVMVDGRRIEPAQLMAYKGLMFGDVPNLVSVFGYTNASWTLKADMVSAYVCRLLAYMDRMGYARCMPVGDPSVEERPWVDFTSGYLERAAGQLPKQGSKFPWRLYQNYMRDRLMLHGGRIDDGILHFETRGAAAPIASSAPAERVPAE